MNITFLIDGTQVDAILYDTAVTRAFLDMLPLELTLNDFGGGTEKVADLPTRLPTDQAPEGDTPFQGDLAYYAPWGNLALFRKDFHYSKGLVMLGKFPDGFAALDRDGPLRVTIEVTGSGE